MKDFDNFSLTSVREDGTDDGARAAAPTHDLLECAWVNLASGVTGRVLLRGPARKLENRVLRLWK